MFYVSVELKDIEGHLYRVADSEQEWNIDTPAVDGVKVMMMLVQVLLQRGLNLNFYICQTEGWWVLKSTAGRPHHQCDTLSTNVSNVSNVIQQQLSTTTPVWHSGDQHQAGVVWEGQDRGRTRT